MALHVTIRAATAADEARWRELWAAYLAFYGEVVPEAVTADTWRRLLTGRDGYQALLACGAGSPPPGDGPHASGAVPDQRSGSAPQERIVGFVHSVPRVNTWSTAPDLYLEDLYVDAEVRGGGVGAALIAAVAARARDLGARKVTWETDADNTVAQRLYDRLASRSTQVHYHLVASS